MRLLYCLPRYDEHALGNQIHTEVIQHWRNLGHEVEIATISSASRRPTMKRVGETVVHYLPTRPSSVIALGNKLAEPVTGYPYLVGAISSFCTFFQTQPGYDVIHVETAFPLGVAVAFTKPHQSKLAITLPGADIMRVEAFDYGYARYRLVRLLIRWTLQQADYVRADSRQIAQVARTYGVSDHKLRAIPYNITDHSFVDAHSNINAYRTQARQLLIDKHQLTDDARIILSLNRLHPFKGIEYLVEALPAILSCGYDAHALIVGPNRTTPKHGDYGAYLQKRAIELGIADRVHLVGAIPHIEARDYLAGADVTVVPSIAESFSRVVIESAAVGTPPVVTRTTGASDYVRDASCGAVVNPQDAHSLAEGVCSAISAHGELSSRCIPFAQAFRSAAIAQELIEIYQSL
ncbi:MAG: glycosyltransferase family 4 protein [Chloroflexi bacterium]|nr:glycosyltransferase family 4 protein [Chloroflexota bacterium]